MAVTLDNQTEEIWIYKEQKNLVLPAENKGPDQLCSHDIKIEPLLSLLSRLVPELSFPSSHFLSFSVSPPKPQAFPSFFPFLFIYLSLNLSFVLPHPKLPLFPFLSVFPSLFGFWFLTRNPLSQSLCCFTLSR